MMTQHPRFGCRWSVVVVVVLAVAVSGCRESGNEATVTSGQSRETSDHIQKEGGPKVKEEKSGSWSPELTDAEKDTLFAIVSDTLKWCVNGKEGEFSFDSYAATDKLMANTATFVTLKTAGQLRGCIGSLHPYEPMYMSVHNNAINASLKDTRFRPVSAAELAQIDVHVSILSPIRDIPSYKEWKLGEQGIILAKGMQKAVFLPEVATEQNWTVSDTLTHLSMKAGLTADAWKQGAKFKVFESVVLSQ